MSTRNTDINLVIRAKNEADAALNAVSGAIHSLMDDAGDASSRVQTLGQTLALLDKASGTVAASVNKAGDALNRQTTNIQENKAALAALAVQQSEARQALAAFGNQSDKAFVGPRTQDFTKNYGAIRSEADRLGTAIEKITRTVASQQSAIDGSQSSLLKLSSTSRAIGDAQQTAEAQIALTTAALKEQASAAGRVTAIRARINAVTGVNRPDATGSASAAATILLEADNIYRRTEARAAEIAKLREQEAVTAELARTEQAERANRQAFGITDDPRGAQARQSAAVFEAAAAAEAQMAAEAKELRAALNPLDAIQEKLNADLARYRELAAAGAISTDELAAAERRLATSSRLASEGIKRRGAAGENGTTAIFGLKPYELQNLSYQINDVFTQLASGTSITQTLAQQGGQIFQLFPKVGGAILGAFSNPAVLAFTVTLGAIIIGLKEAGDAAERLRSFTATLNLRADGGDYNAKALADQQRALENMGIAAKDAEAAVKSFLDNGIAPGRLAQFSQTAKDTADVLGIKLPDAAKQVADAFSGGFKAVADFDDKLNFLTATQRENIRVLFEEGRAEEARTTALGIFSAKMQQVSDDARGPWSDAARALRAAWGTFIDYISDRQWVTSLGQGLDYLADRALSLVEKLNGARTIGSLTKDLEELLVRIGDLNRSVADFGDPLGAKRSQISELEARAKAIAKQIGDAKAALNSGRPTGDTITNDPNSVRAKQRNDRIAQISTEEELQRLRDAGSRRVLNAAETARRAELAGIEAAKSEQDEVVKQAVKRAAIAKEIAATEKSNDSQRKAALADRERQIRQFEQRVVAAEGGTAKNPYSSAKGYGQFTESTFIDVYKRTPGADQSLGRDQILALRSNERIARGVLDQYARENARFLERFGAQVTAGNLYLAHFLGAGGAKKVLTANGATPVDQLGLGDAVLKGNQNYLRVSKGGRYRTADELKKFIAGRVGDTGEAQTGLVEEQNRIQQANIERQENLNRAIRQGNEDRQRTIDTLKAEAGLFGTALIAEQRKQALIKAELDLRQQVENANRNLKPGETAAVVTDEQIAKVRELEGALFDAARARDVLNARKDDAQRPVDNIDQQISLLREQADFLRSVGDLAGAQKIDAQITALQAKLRSAIDTLIEFYRALSPAERAQLGIIDEQQLDNIIKKLEAAKRSTQEWGKIAGISAKDIAQAFASSAVNAVTGFLEKIANGENVFKAFGEAILEMAANFASAVAQMILQLLAYAAAVAILKALGVPVPGGDVLGSVVGATTGNLPGTSGGGTTTVPTHHTGGIAGNAAAPRRTVDPAWFTGAMRLHGGGIPGLRRGEVPAILMNDEEVLTSDDPRHRWNGGGVGQQPKVDLKIVNAIDAGGFVSEGMQTRSGQRAMLNFIQSNKGAVKAVLAD